MNKLPTSVRTRDGSTLILRHWKIPDQIATRGVICVVHGLGEHIGRYERLATRLNQSGWSVVGYDQRGHGKSAGSRGVIYRNEDLLHDLASVLDTVQPLAADQKLVLLGHSLGGLVVARFVAALAEPNENSPWQRTVDFCVLSSPALALHLSWIKKLLIKTLGIVMPNLAMGNGLKPEWLCTDQEVVSKYLSDPLVHGRISGRLATFMMEAGEIVRRRATSWQTPTLLLYSGADRCVNSIGSDHFASDAPQTLVESHVYDKLKHEILNEPIEAGVYRTLVDWLRKIDSAEASSTFPSIGKTRSSNHE